jgi:para-aminobenzoate synthetase component 1
LGSTTTASLFICEIAHGDPFAAFRRFAHLPGAVFLDSARPGAPFGRYSFIAADPFLTLESRDGRIVCGDRRWRGDPFAALEELLARYRIESQPSLPPFQGGVAGWFAYDLGRHLERLPAHRLDDQPVADLMLGCYDLVLAFDHEAGRAWAISSGLPETGAARATRAQMRLAWAIDLLGGPEPPLAPLPALPPPVPDIDRPTFEKMVARTVDYIYAGDIYQANISQRFRAGLPDGYDCLALYARLRRDNPAPFAAYLRFGETAIVSASPERFLRLQDGKVETRPIKGTRPRGRSAVEDRILAEALAASPKDRAENLMIVDLLRNDLSRVCRPHSVQVPSLFAVESFATVHHLVSTVTGTLSPGKGAVDLLRATFPGGSITGAPKIRAMEIIAELEKNRRGPYCGSIGYIGFDGAMDTSIVIRTIVCAGGIASFQAGGGIVADSEPAAEYQETLDKARALIAALSGGSQERAP